MAYVAYFFIGFFGIFFLKLNKASDGLKAIQMNENKVQQSKSNKWSQSNKIHAHNET